MDPAKLKVVELRAELSKRGLDSKGNKPVLVERLRQALEEEKSHPKAHSEASQKIEFKSESEDEGSSSEVKLPPRTPSRSSRHRSREPTTPAKTPTRRSSSRSSLSRQSPVKTILTENPNETASNLEPIAEEDKILSKEDEDTTPKKESAPTSPKKESTPKKEPVSTTPKKDIIKDVSSTPEEELSSVDSTEESVSVTPKKENVQNETSNTKENKLEVVKEAEKHIPDESEEIITTVVDDVCKKSVEKMNVQSPEKSKSPNKPITQSPTKIASESPTKPLNQSPSKLSVESPIKSTSQMPAAESPTKTIHSTHKFDTQSAVKSTSKSPIKLTSESPVKSSSQSPLKPSTPQKSPVKDTMESPNKKLKNEEVESMETEKEILEDESKDADENMAESNDESMQVDQESNMQTEDQQDDNVDKKLDEKSDEKSDEKMDEKMSEKSDDRKRKRSLSPREDVLRAPPSARPENEPNFDDSAVLLSWYDSDLNLVIDTTNYFSASPMQGDGFNFMWAGVRASYGYAKGKVYYEARINIEFDNMATVAATNASGAIPADEEKIPSALRLGWSTIGTSLQLGEDALSYGYESAAKKAVNKEFVEYGKTFAKGDFVGCYADFETDGNVTLTYTINGETQGPAFVIKKEELEGKALFPHILSKNCSFTVNFGQEDHWSENVLDGYDFVGKVDLDDRIAGPRRPEKREDCEVILLCGLPFSGKTSWALKHVAEHPEKLYSVLGVHNLIEKMRVDGVSLKEIYKGRWETVVEKCSRALTKLLDSAPSRRRNYILDQQANVYGSAQRRKMRNFYGFHRKAVILVPSDEEFKSRIAKRKEEADGEEIRESSILEVKANLNAPTVGESFEEVEWAELGEEEGKKLIETYNTEGKTAGYGQSPQQPNKRSRFDNGQKDRNNRDNRDHRRSGYNDRRNTGAWRGGPGGGGGGWRDSGRMRGPMGRHSTGYGAQGAWRGRGGSSLTPRSAGMDRRTGGGTPDRRQGNDRNRSSGAHRSSGWNAMGYQGNQHANTGVWSGQSNWQNQSQGNWGGQQTTSAWNQQQAWGGAASSWKGYSQNSYGQSSTSGYGQGASNYGNGNWSNWNPQYYNQYWSGSGQQQATGQTTGQTQAAAGIGGSQSVNKK